MVVEHPALAHILKIAFNRVWERGLDYDEAFARRSSAMAALAASPHTA